MNINLLSGKRSKVLASRIDIEWRLLVQGVISVS